MENINWYGAYSLSLRETKRFLSVYHQTIFTPVVSALIFLAVFVLALGQNKAPIDGIEFTDFMGYGLISMYMTQNAFANSSSSFIASKIMGYIMDILTPPLGSTEIIIAFTIGATLRGVCVGAAVAISLAPFITYTLAHPFLLIFYVIASCMLLGQMGLLSGIISNTFDKHSAVTSYVVTPLSFLSGTFYSVNSLPYIFAQINLLNPFFYIIDGFRYCLSDKADGNIQVGILFLISANIIMYFVLTKLIDKGWRIKS